MLSAVILAKNEESSIVDAIKSVSFCDEVVVIDNSSDDQTAAVAKKAGAIVYSSDSSDFSQLRTLGQQKAKGDWLLFVDADERVTPELRNEIQQVIASAANDAYFIPRREFFWGKEVKFGEVLEARVNGFIRLVKKNSGTWKGEVHETFVPKRQAGRLQNALQHYSHKGIADFLVSVNLFSTVRAKEMYKDGYKASGIAIVFIPFLKFMYTYLALGGFLDGARGFVYSFMMSFHAFLARSKVYLMSSKSSDLEN